VSDSAKDEAELVECMAQATLRTKNARMRAAIHLNTDLNAVRAALTGKSNIVMEGRDHESAVAGWNRRALLSSRIES
jgi:hypothetical protein